MRSVQHGHCGHELIASSRVIAGLTLSEITYPPGLVLPQHSHKCAGFCLVLKGTYAEDYNNTILSCRPQTVTFSPAGAQHSNHFYGAGSHCFTIDVEPLWLDRLCEYGLTLDRPADFRGGALLWAATRLYKEFREKDSASSLAIEGLALEMAAETLRCSASPPQRKVPPWLNRTLELLRAEFKESASLKEIARRVGVHPVYLASEFRRRYDLTVGEYVRQLRIEHASRELSTSDMPLVEIALNAGFSSQSHFSWTFKRLTGMTPAQFRASSRS